MYRRIHLSIYLSVDVFVYATATLSGNTQVFPNVYAYKSYKHRCELKKILEQIYVSVCSYRSVCLIIGVFFIYIYITNIRNHATVFSIYDRTQACIALCFLSWHSIWQNREHYGSGLGLLRLSYRLASHLPHERRHLAPETCLSQHEQGLRRHVGTSAENSLGNLLTTSTGLPRSTDSKPVLPRNGSFLCILCLPCTGTCETETTSQDRSRVWVHRTRGLESTGLCGGTVRSRPR